MTAWFRGEPAPRGFIWVRDAAAAAQQAQREMELRREVARYEEARQPVPEALIEALAAPQKPPVRLVQVHPQWVDTTTPPLVAHKPEPETDHRGRRKPVKPEQPVSESPVQPEPEPVLQDGEFDDTEPEPEPVKRRTAKTTRKTGSS